MEPELEYREVGAATVAELMSGIVADERDATDLVGNASFGGADYVLVHATSLPPEFFDLSSGFAGEVLQKFSNYRLVLIVVVFDSAAASTSMAALMRESNRSGSVWFVVDTVEANARIQSAG